MGCLRGGMVEGVGEWKVSFGADFVIFSRIPLSAVLLLR